MRSMAIDRRSFLAQLGALALVPAAQAAPAGPFLAARGNAGGAYFISRFDERGQIGYDTRLPGRGHGVAISSDGRLAVAVARRPGGFLLTFDATTGAVRQTVKAPKGAVFCGHAAFSTDDRLLYATETQEEHGSGQIGVFDVRDRFRRVAAWPTHGDDPHELLVFDDALVVANGGFGPDGSGAIDPSLVRLDLRNGRLLAQVKPPEELRAVSLRHLARLGRGMFVAGQYAGPARDRPPLVARWDGGALDFIDLPRADLDRLGNYCGSIAANAAGTCLCVASPHGGRAVIFDADGRVMQRVSIADVCGVAQLGPGFVLTGGRGDVAATETGAVARVEDARWDNHVTALPHAP
jgi:hypothetical protein